MANVTVTIRTKDGPVTKEVPEENLAAVKQKYGASVTVEKPFSMADYAADVPAALRPADMPAEAGESEAGELKSGLYGALTSAGSMGLRGLGAVTLSGDEGPFGQAAEKLEAWGREKESKSDPRRFKQGEMLGSALGGVAAARGGVGGIKAIRGARARSQAKSMAKEAAPEAAQQVRAERRGRVGKRAQAKIGVERARQKTLESERLERNKQLGEERGKLRDELKKLKPKKKPAKKAQISLGRGEPAAVKPTKVPEATTKRIKDIKTRLAEIDELTRRNRAAEQTGKRVSAEAIERQARLRARAETPPKKATEVEVARREAEIMRALEKRGIPSSGGGKILGAMRDTAGYVPGKLATGTHLGGVTGKALLRAGTGGAAAHGKVRPVPTEAALKQQQASAVTGLAGGLGASESEDYLTLLRMILGEDEQ